MLLFYRLMNIKKINCDVIFVYITSGIAFFSIALLFIILGYAALPFLFDSDDSSPFTWVWAPQKQLFGILPMLCNSIILSISSLILSFPLALAISCWIIAIGKGLMLTIVKFIIYFMTAIPTVIYGFTALFLLTPIIRKLVGSSGLCWLTACLILTILILPTMVLIITTGIKNQLDLILPSGIALGYNRFELLYFFVLPNARKTLLTAGLLGMGRAIGDTLIPLMLAGNATAIPSNLSDSLRTLAAHMALVTANEVSSRAYGSLFVACFLLFLINAILSFLAYKIGKKCLLTY